MRDDEPLPLWKEAIPDREPWRRGRVAIISISAFVLVVQALNLISAILRGDINALLGWAVGGVFACLFLYLIWIGQNWARWIVAPFFGLFGFAALIWAMVYSQGDVFFAGRMLLSGAISITIFSYLALSPAVYAFARRQRENVTWWQSLAIGAGFLLVLGSIGSAVFAFQIYKSGLEQEATEFAQLAFRRVFQNHDATFLEAHSTRSRKNSRPTEFINMVDDQLGQPLEVGPFGGPFHARLEGRQIALSGRLEARAVFETGAAWVHIDVAGKEREWAIEHISWSP